MDTKPDPESAFKSTALLIVKSFPLFSSQGVYPVYYNFFSPLNNQVFCLA